jgi:hypothetical protein
MLVCRHLNAWISKRGNFPEMMSSFEISKVDAFQLQILHKPKKAALRPRVVRVLAAMPWRGREKG